MPSTSSQNSAPSAHVSPSAHAPGPPRNPKPTLAAGQYARLPGHDYAGWGYYMITFSIFPRRDLFSRIENYSAVLTPAGKIMQETWLKMAEECPQISLREYAIMPDHFHGIVVMEPGNEHPLGYWINRVKGRTTHALRKLFGNPELQIWEANFHDYISFCAETFAVYREYVAANPRRLQLRRENRHRLGIVRRVEHWRLVAANHALKWDCLGDIALLDYPWLLPIVIHRRDTPEAKAKQIAAIVEAVKRGAIPIGGFISPDEKQALKEIAALPKARVIRLLPYGLKEFKPHGRQLENLAESRLLILSAFPEALQGCNYANCHANNALACAVAQASALTAPL